MHEPTALSNISRNVQVVRLQRRIGLKALLTLLPPPSKVPKLANRHTFVAQGRGPITSGIRALCEELLKMWRIQPSLHGVCSCMALSSRPIANREESLLCASQLHRSPRGSVFEPV